VYRRVVRWLWGDPPAAEGGRPRKRARFAPRPPMSAEEITVVSDDDSDGGRREADGWQPPPGSSSQTEQVFSFSPLNIPGGSNRLDPAFSPIMSTDMESPRPGGLPTFIPDSGESASAAGRHPEGAILHPVAHSADVRLGAFHSGLQPQDGACFTPAVRSMSLFGSGSGSSHADPPSVLQRREEERYRQLFTSRVLTSQEDGLRQRRMTKEADKVAVQRRLLRHQRFASDLFDDVIQEGTPGGSVGPSPYLGTRHEPRADPLGLSIFSEYGMAPGDDEDDSAAERTAFKALSTPGLTARQKIQLLRRKSFLHIAQTKFQSREADILFDKERIMMKLILKKAEDQLLKSQSEQSFLQTAFASLMQQCIQAVCQRVVPIVPLTDILRRFKASGASTLHLRNKEFLPLAPEDLERCADAWNPAKPEDEVLVNAFGFKLLRKDLRTLAGSAWLNDEVINMYMELLRERASLAGFPRCHFFNTFFYHKLSGGGQGYNYNNVKRWTRKVDIFEFDKLIIPIHLSAHWTCAVINFRDKRFEYYDSLGGQGRNYLELLQLYLADEHKDKRKKLLDTTAWTYHMPGSAVPQQLNFSDCGMFSCKFMNSQAQDLPYAFRQQNMPYFRQRLVIELLNAKVL
jgi:sentrin-specific protease 1